MLTDTNTEPRVLLFILFIYVSVAPLIIALICLLTPTTTIDVFLSLFLSPPSLARSSFLTLLFLSLSLILVPLSVVIRK